MAISNPVDIGGATANNASSTTIALTTTATVPSGAKIWICVGWFDSAGTTFTATVAGGSLTWTTDAQGENLGGGSGTGCALASADAPTGLASGTTITATISSSAADRSICGMYSTGVATGAGAAYGATGHDDDNTTAASSGNITVLNGDILIFGSHWEDGTPPSFTANGGNTKVHDFNAGSGGTGYATGYQIGTGAAIAGSGTWSSASNALSGTRTQAVAYTAAATAGGGVVAQPILWKLQGFQRPGLPQLWPNLRPGSVITAPQTFPQALTATTTGTASFTLQVGKNVNATTSNTASLVKQVGKIVSATTAGTATIVKQVGKILSATTTNVATLIAQKAKLLTLSATTTNTATIVKQVGKILSATTTDTATIVKQVGKILAATTTNTATIVAQKARLLVMAATTTSTATITRQIGKTVAATTTNTATITKRVGKTIGAVTISVASIIADFVGPNSIFTGRFDRPNPGPIDGGSIGQDKFGASPDSSEYDPGSPRRG